MRSLVNPETFTAFMQNLKLEHYQKKKRKKTQHSLKLVVCQVTGGLCKRKRIPDFLFGEESMTSGKMKYLR